MQILKRSGHYETCMGLHEQVRGLYTLRIRDAETKQVKREVGPFANDLTTIGLNRIGTATDPMPYGYVGTGTNAPQASDTSMGVFKVRNDSAVESNLSPTAPMWYDTLVLTYTFNAGTISGNITEVGVGWTVDSSSGLWSRQLILDGNGLPVTMTVLPNEILELVYALRYYPPGLEDFTGSFVLNGVTYNYLARLGNAGATRVVRYGYAGGPGIAQVYAAGATLGAITSTITGTGVPPPTVTHGTYVNNSLKATALSSFSLAQGNHASGIQAFAIILDTGGLKFFRSQTQMLLDKPIPKTNLNTMSITMETSWGKYTGPL